MSVAYEASLRHAQYDDVVVSAHFDDAVFSLGGSMLAWRSAGRRVLVITVFGHGANTPPSQNSAFGDYATREGEDRRAMAALDVDYLWLNQPELLFRPRRAVDIARYLLPFTSLQSSPAFVAMLPRLLEVLDGLGANADLHFPLAIGSHPDHRLVFDAGRRLAKERRIHFYEDVPYALLPTFVELRLAYLTGSRAPSVTKSARDLAVMVNREPSDPTTFLPMVTYMALVAAAFRTLRLFRRDFQPLVREERRVAPFVDKKAHAMRAYASQIGLFFSSPETLEHELPTHEGVPVERCWRFT